MDKENSKESQRSQAIAFNPQQILKEKEGKHCFSPSNSPILKEQSSDSFIDFSKEFFPQPFSTINASSNEMPKLFVNDKLIHNGMKQHCSQLTNDLSPSNFELNETVDTPEEQIMRQKDQIEEEDYAFLKGKFFGIVTSQNGSRFLQRIYLNSSRDICENIFKELLPHLNTLMTDPYANYFCPKLYSILSQTNKIAFLKQLASDIVPMSKSKKGIFSLQSVLDLVKSREEKEIIINSLAGNVIELCLNEMGVHLVEKVIICFEEDLIRDVYETIIDNFCLLAQNPYGLFACKKLIICARNFCTLSKIRDKLKENSMLLIKNQYGNYTLQVAVDNWPADVSKPLIESFNGNFFRLSMEKYSSNVLEKCLEKSDEKQLTSFIEEILGNNCIICLIKNSYGNYVLQKAFKLSVGKVRTKFLSAIKNSLEKLHDNKLKAKWKGIINNTSHLTVGNGGNPGTDQLNISGASNHSCNSNHSSGQNKTMPMRSSKSSNGSPFLNSMPLLPLSFSPMLSPAIYSPQIRSPMMTIQSKYSQGSPLMNPQFIQYPHMFYQFPLSNHQWRPSPNANAYR